MTTEQKPLALELADICDKLIVAPFLRGIGPELRRQHSEIEGLCAQVEALTEPLGRVRKSLVDRKINTDVDEPELLRTAANIIAEDGGVLAHLGSKVEALTRDCGRQASKIVELIADLKFQEGKRQEDRAQLQTIYEHQRGEAWYWQGDGQDHLESMAGSLPVVIRADQLRELTRPAVPSEHYDEVRATLTGLHALCVNISNMERRVGPLGSHARGYTHKITAALRHLDRLAAAPQPPSAEPLARFCPGCGSVGPVDPKFRDCCPDGNKARLIPQRLAEHCHDLFQLALRSMIDLTDDTMRAIRTRALDEFGTGQAQGELWDQILMRETARTIQVVARGGA